jgi:hypothetical protein
MTVDSAYYIERKKISADVSYSFQMESVGDEAMHIYLVNPDGTRTELTNEVLTP